MGSALCLGQSALLWLPGLHSVLPQTTGPDPCKLLPATDLGRGTEYVHGDSRDVSDTATEEKFCLD